MYDRVEKTRHNESRAVANNIGPGRINRNQNAKIDFQSDKNINQSIGRVNKVSQLLCNPCKMEMIEYMREKPVSKERPKKKINQLKCKCDDENKQLKPKVNSEIIQMYKNCTESDHHSSIEEKSIVKNYNENINSNAAVGEMALKDDDSWRFADLVDLKSEEIYEIKTTKTGEDQAESEAKYYKKLLNKNCKGNWTLGKKFDEQEIDSQYFTTKYYSPGSGAILYENEEK
jgi:hypothetical protein